MFNNLYIKINDVIYLVLRFIECSPDINCFISIYNNRTHF